MDAIIIAHSPQLRTDISQALAKHAPEIALCGAAAYLSDARALLKTHQPYLVLMSTDLPDAPGLALLEQSDLPIFETIVLSTSDEWAYLAFQKQLLGYVIWPTDRGELATLLEKFRQRNRENGLLQQLQLMLRGNSSVQRSPDRIVLHLSDGVHILSLGDTIRLESEGNYTTFFTTHNERIMVTKPIGEFEHLTHNNSFFRVHQSHIININFVRKVLKEDGCSIVLENNVRIPLARRRKEEFFRVLGV